MYYTGPGWEYAKQRRGREYDYSDPDALYVYSGSHWKQLIAAFPDDSLADDAAWAIAQRRRAGECEGGVTCLLTRDVEPAVQFMQRFPHSNFDSAAVAKANAALTRILDRIPDLRARDKDTIDADYDPAPVESLLVRYDAVAVLLSPSLRAAVHGVTGPLWVRLGKPERRP